METPVYVWACLWKADVLSLLPVWSVACRYVTDGWLTWVIRTKQATFPIHWQKKKSSNILEWFVIYDSQ